MRAPYERSIMVDWYPESDELFIHSPGRDCDCRPTVYRVAATEFGPAHVVIQHTATKPQPPVDTGEVLNREHGEVTLGGRKVKATEA